MRESTVENAAKDYAEDHGWTTYKWTSPSNRGVPDRLFFRNGKTLIIEFKAPGKKPTKLQQHHIKKLHAQKIETLVVDNKNGFSSIFD